jgi:hypothetical protein
MAAGGSNCVVFLGPSLPVAEARQLLAADYRPPARQGSVYELIGSGVEGIALIDGVFHGEPSVWQREVLDAVDAGIEVWGASSMGALRAAELHTLGVRGFGTVFEWYAGDVIDADDEVALRHGSVDDGYRALSEPMVNIRATLDAAVAAAVISDERRAELIARARATYYPERSLRALAPEDAQLSAWLKANRVDIKRADARGLLAHLAANPPTRRAARAPARCSEWTAQRTMDRRLAAMGPTLGELCALPTMQAELHRLRPALIERWLRVRWATERGVSCPPDELAAFTRAFEVAHGVVDRAAWLRSVGLTSIEYERELADRALAAWLDAVGPAAFGIVGYADDWAACHGLTPLLAGVRQLGPEMVGFHVDDWHAEGALVRDLQLTGRLGAVAGPTARPA